MAERAAKQLELNKSELPNSITEVIATLSRAGFDAYIVGGGVRDTLLGLKPKDFDAVTDAKPHEIKDVFGKRCRIIGRRFQLAHVYSGRELIEVATFRGPPTNDANTNQDGMIIRDNVWGDIKQDFSRRDFSINALYYQPLKGVVHDFCGALDDIRSKTIRLLGQASVRIEEDPVRLLRALRFKAKLGFDFDQELSEQFHDNNWSRLEQISPHRLYDETQKMFTGGYLVPLLPLLFESGAIDSLIIYPPDEPSALVKQVAINTDKRISAGKSINPAFFYAALLWENYLHQLEKAKKRNMPFAEAQMHAASKVVDRQRIRTAIPKFAEQFIRDIWILQPKLAAPRSKQIEQLAEHPRFRAGFDFLLLREQCGDAEHPLSESTNGMGDWWQHYQTLSENQQQQAINDFDENIRRGAHKRGRGRNRQPQKPTHDNSAVNQQENDTHAHTHTHKQANNGNESAVVNDSSNIPARRRRAPDKSIAPDFNNQSQSRASQSQAKQSQAKQPSSKRSPQAKHDSNELAQLQQLSLSNSNNSGHSPTQNTAQNTTQSTAPGYRNSDKADASKQQPAPLFVIEHENVVPPLRKHLAEDKQTVKASQPEKRKVMSEKKVSAAHEKVNADSNGSSKDQGDGVRSSNSQQSKKQPLEHKQAAVANAYLVRSVAQSPKMVSIDNEPIPYKRRRRQPSVEPVNDAPVNDKSNKSSSTTNYSKKPPIAADSFEAKVVESQKTADAKVANQKAKSADLVESTAVENTSKVSSENNLAVDQVVKADTNEQSLIKQSVNKGPIPSKRRRRQPSIDISGR